MRQFNKHTLGVLVNGTGKLWVVVKVSNTKEAHGHSTCQTQNHPGHADAASMNDAMVGICSHKARQNMRLTKVAQTPAHQGNDGNKIQPFEHVHVLNALLFNHFQRILEPTHTNNNHHRRQDQGEDHQAGLDGIGPAYCQETTDKGIDDRRGRARPKCCFVAHAKGTFKQTRPCHNP